MRFLLAPSGSRGDFQPLLALAVALRAAGHEVLLAAAPDFASEAGSFGVPFRPVGRAVQRLLEERAAGISPMAAARLLAEEIPEEFRLQLEGLLPLAAHADLVVGAGTQAAAATVAERHGIPYRYVCYTPQMLPSAHHVHTGFPLPNLPARLIPASWWLERRLFNMTLGKHLNATRRSLGMPPAPDVHDYLVPPGGRILAFDPEIQPLPPDVFPEAPPTGAWHLPDQRPLGDPLERFLAAGPPPLYAGFGSMPDANPRRTSGMLIAAARAVGRRLVLSSGWARLGGENIGDDVFVAGSVSHATLFPRVAAIVHHAGAGTSAAAARAGVPQVPVPHAFDQFGFSRRMQALGVAPGWIARTKLTAGALAALLRAAVRDPSARERAAALGETLRARDGLANAVELLTGARSKSKSESIPDGYRSHGTLRTTDRHF